MEANPRQVLLSAEETEAMSLKVSQVLTPQTPISTRALFAGRWDEIKQVVDIVAQTGLHAVLFGERGVGKTSLANVIPFLLDFFDKSAKSPKTEPRIALRVTANTKDTFSSVWRKAFGMIAWNEEAPTIGFRPGLGSKMMTLLDAYGLDHDLGIDHVHRVLANMPHSVFVFDEFDRLGHDAAIQFTDLIKALSDDSVPTTILLVGVAETVDQLVADHASIPRALVQIRLHRMKLAELRAIIENAEKELGIIIEQRAGESIAVMSQGLPHYTHLVGLHAIRAACSRCSRVVFGEDVSKGFQQAVRNADQTISQQYARATSSSQGAALYGHVLLACALAAASESDALGYFQPANVVAPLTKILSRDKPIEISTFNRHLGEFCEPKRGQIFGRTGQARSYRYRFQDPLLLPYVLMRGISDGVIQTEDLVSYMQSTAPHL